MAGVEERGGVFSEVGGGMSKPWHYILDGKIPIPCDDFMRWARSFEISNRRVAEMQLGETYVSTVFLGTDHSFGDGPPMLFETMIFGGKHDGYCERYSTWEQAEAGHARILEMLRGLH